MKHIILAAGMGTRLFPDTLETPKVLLPIAGRTLLFHQIHHSLGEDEIKHIVVVTGYKSEQVDDYIVKNFKNELRVTTVFNSDFEINNPIYSLIAAMPEIEDEDFLITNGDVYYPPSLLREVVAQPEGISMVISPYRDRSSRAMSVHFSQGRMVAIYPHAPELDSYESPGIVFVKGSEARNIFFHATERLYKRHLGQPHFWHDILNEAKLEMPIQTLTVREDIWGEVDEQDDLESVEKLSRDTYGD
jgi:choline kinase